MEYVNLNLSKEKAFDVCRNALNIFECEITENDLSSGEICAKKSGGFLSYGHKIIVNLNNVEHHKTKISVSSNSIGVQIIDWGTNSENEVELIKLIISNSR